MKSVSFPFPKLTGIGAAFITMFALIFLLALPVTPATAAAPTPTLKAEYLSTGVYEPDNPAFIYSGTDWDVKDGSASTLIEHAIVLWHVSLKEPGVVIVEYRSSPGAGQFQVQIDSDEVIGPLSQSTGDADSKQYWVSPTLKAGSHRIFLSSLDNGPVNFSRVAVGPVVKARDAAFDNSDPGAIIFGEWTEKSFPITANKGKAIISGENSGPIFVVFEQKFPGSVNVNLISTSEHGQAHVVLDGIPTNFPYQTPGEPIAVSIITGKTEPGRHVLMITGDGKDNIVRFDGFKISEKIPANMPTMDPKKDPESPEYVPEISVDHQRPALSAGKYHACYLSKDGGVQCRGYNASGQLGRGPEGSSLSILPLAPVHNLEQGVLTIAAGGSHTCALLESGPVMCWGNGQFGQLGNGISKTVQNEPVEVTGLAGPVVDITAGEYHTCALLKNGKIQCWGLNGAGQLGNGITREFLGRNVPVDVIGLPAPAQAIAAGTNHTCARLMNGTVWCWGNDEYGQLGDGTYVKSVAEKGKATPVQVAGLENASLLAAGARHTCALAGKDVFCWGDNSSGQLGDGTTEASPLPVQVTGLYSGVYAITAGEKHTCALSPDQSVTVKGIQCWGDNSFDQMGNASKEKFSSIPVDVTGYSGEKVSITAGFEYTCVLSKDDQAYCWGITSYGQGGSTPDSTPSSEILELSPGLTPIPGLQDAGPMMPVIPTPTPPSVRDVETG
jgi:hypothetical protein